MNPMDCQLGGQHREGPFLKLHIRELLRTLSASLSHFVAGHHEDVSTSNNASQSPNSRA